MAWGMRRVVASYAGAAGLHRISGQHVPLSSSGAGRSSLHLPVQRVVASLAGAEGLCTASCGSRSLLPIRRREEVVASPARAAGPCSKSGGREVVASPAGAEGRCFACRCRGSLLHLPVQWVVASYAGAKGVPLRRGSGLLHCVEMWSTALGPNEHLLFWDVWPTSLSRSGRGPPLPNPWVGR